MYDYKFSSDIDVILKGYYPVAAYLWIWGFKSAPNLPLSCPCSFFHQTAAILHTSHDGLAPLFSHCSWTVDPRAKVPLLTGLNVLFMAPVQHSKLLDHNQNKTAQSSQEKHFPCWNKIPRLSVAVVLWSSCHATISLWCLNLFAWMNKSKYLILFLDQYIWLCSSFFGCCDGWIIYILGWKKRKKKPRCLPTKTNQLKQLWVEVFA